MTEFEGKGKDPIRGNNKPISDYGQSSYQERNSTTQPKVSEEKDPYRQLAEESKLDLKESRRRLRERWARESLEKKLEKEGYLDVDEHQRLQEMRKEEKNRRKKLELDMQKREERRLREVAERERRQQQPGEEQRDRQRELMEEQAEREKQEELRRIEKLERNLQERRKKLEETERDRQQQPGEEQRDRQRELMEEQAEREKQEELRRIEELERNLQERRHQSGAPVPDQYMEEPQGLSEDKEHQQKRQRLEEEDRDLQEMMGEEQSEWNTQRLEQLRQNLDRIDAAWTLQFLNNPPYVTEETQQVVWSNQSPEDWNTDANQYQNPTTSNQFLRQQGQGSNQPPYDETNIFQGNIFPQNPYERRQ